MACIVIAAQHRGPALGCCLPGRREGQGRAVTQQAKRGRWSLPDCACHRATRLHPRRRIEHCAGPHVRPQHRRQSVQSGVAFLLGRCRRRPLSHLVLRLLPFPNRCRLALPSAAAAAAGPSAVGFVDQPHECWHRLGVVRHEAGLGAGKAARRKTSAAGQLNPWASSFKHNGLGTAAWCLPAPRRSLG